jgi:hypothetical protein
MTVVLKDIRALVIFAELAVTRRDHFPMAAGDSKADLNKLASPASGEYVPDKEHLTKGTSFKRVGKI